jgi:hypothetical protein
LAATQILAAAAWFWPTPPARPPVTPPEPNREIPIETEPNSRPAKAEPHSYLALVRWEGESEPAAESVPEEVLPPAPLKAGTRVFE